MDPLTQGALGAALPQATWVAWTKHQKAQVAAAGVLGMLSGMAADLDVLIRSDTDPLMFLAYHRQFTHSLIFIPLGGLITAIALHGIFARRWQLSFWQTVIICTLGYATHALLDSATSYGTQLFWPFSETRISWSIISIIDPLFTLPLAGLVIMAAIKGNPWLARLGLVWGLLYLSVGWMQHQSALQMAENIAASRSHTPTRLEVKPSFGNILVWKSIYETEDRFYVDAVRAGVAPKVFQGTSLPKFDRARDLPWLAPTSQQARDIDRFSGFSDGFVAMDPDQINRIIDVRYSFVPNDVSALFSIELTPGSTADTHVHYRTHREHARDNIHTLWQMLVSTSPQ